MGSVVGCLAVHTKGVKAYLPTIKAIADKLIAKGKSPEEAWTKATESQIKSLTGELEKTHKAIVKKYEAEHGEIKAPDTPERRALDRSAEAYASDMKEKRYASDMKEKRSAQKAEDARARASEKPKTDTVGTPAEPWVDAAARMRASVRGEGEIGKTPERTQQVEDTLRGAFHDPAGFDKVIGVVHDEHDPRLPPDVRETLHSSDAKVQAMYDPKTKKTWVLAHNVPEGRELGVALHEIGVHMGMKNFLGRENYHKLVGQLRSWAAEGKGKEGELARKARDRVLQAEEKLGKKYDPETFNEEHLAYFVEEAVKDGIDPTAVKGTTQINRWFRTLWAAAKAAVRKLGMDPSKLTAQHVVDMAYGAARLELNGTWHGTAAEFRRFDHSHMGTGEGVQAYGHGTYLAQGVGIAKDKLLTPAKRYWRELGNTMAKQGPKALTNAQLAEQYGDRLPSLATHHELLNRVSMEQRRILHEAHRVIPEWSKLSDEDLNRVHEVMHDATMQGMHPDEAFGKGGNDHLTSGADLVKYNKLRTLFSSLSPDAKAVYTKSRDILKDLHEQELEFHAGVTKAVYKPLIDAAWKSGDTKEAARLLKVQSKDIAESTKDIKSVKGPYFPLMRFGDHVAIVKSPEFVKNQGALEGLSGKEHTAAVDALDAMKKDPKHYEVQSFDKISDAEKFRDDQMSKGMTGEVKLADEHFASERPVSAAGLEKINHLMESQFDSATGRKVKEVMTAMYLASLPDRAAMKRRVGRIGVAGASKDMLRAFAESTERSAFHMSRLKYTKDIAANMFKMKQEARDAGTDMQHVHQNVQARLALDYTYTPNNPLVNGIASLSSMYHLTMSPSFLVQNALQTHLITAPELAGRHGMPKTLKALNAAWVDASKIIPAGKGGVFNLNDMDLGHMTAGHERDMLEHMRGLGQLEITQNQDMGMLAVGHSPTMVKATQVANWATHHTELHNRITTALAAYRLELGKKPGDYEGAKKAAYTALMRTQLDYSRENSPYAMRAGKINQAVGPLIWQFRKFQQGMTYLLLDNAKKAWGGDKEARRSLMYLMGAQAAVAGLRGIPFIMAPLAVANWFSSDDDKDGNVETQLRNYTADLLGPAASRVLWKGAPNLAGADMSNSLGMGTMFFPVPYTDMHDIAKQKTGEMKLLKAVGAVAGAWTGTASQILDAISYFNEGNMTKGFEKALPKVLASPVKAWDISENGMTTPNGAVTMPADKFDAVDIFLKSMGLQSTVESEHYEAQKVKGNASQAIHDKAKSLKDQYVAAVLKGESLSGVREDVAAFNLAHPNNRVLPQDLLQSVAARRRIQATGTDDAGVGFRKNEAELKGIDNFAK